jgi:dolichol-phosphate mannosyltransferase
VPEGPEISVIVPTLNEAPNLPVLAARVQAALEGRRYELLIVDDNSTDGTAETCAELEVKYPLKLIRRAQPHAGLSGAVLEGMSKARGEFLVVMDGDLQHPPERLPELLAPLAGGEADFVIGSRYVEGGSTEGRWSVWRRVNSTLATLLARPICGSTRDPMSGYFALRRSTYESAGRLTPLGYKIGLELLCKCRPRQVREVPIHFGLRVGGRSKLTMREQFRYLEHLSRLYDFSYPRAAPMVKFLIAEGIAWLVGWGVMLGLAGAGWQPGAATTAAYGGVVGALAVFHLRYTRTQREFLSRAHPWTDFMVSSAAEWVVCAATALWLQGRLGSGRATEVLAPSFAAATAVRYLLRRNLRFEI